MIKSSQLQSNNYQLFSVQLQIIVHSVNTLVNSVCLSLFIFRFPVLYRVAQK